MRCGFAIVFCSYRLLFGRSLDGDFSGGGGHRFGDGRSEES